MSIIDYIVDDGYVDNDNGSNDRDDDGDDGR